MPAAEIPEWLEAPWRCWHQLSAGRPHTLAGFAAPMGGMMLRSFPGRIPWPDIMAWADRHEYGSDEAEWLVAVIQQMDAAYLGWWQSKNGQ